MDQPPGSDWLESERWAWSRIVTAGVADFTSTHVPDEARNAEIRGSFISLVLLTEPYRSTVLPQGFQMVGARVTGNLTLSHAGLAQPLRLESSEFEGEVVLPALRSSEDVSFRRSTFKSGLNMDGARIGGDLDLAEISIDSHPLSLERVVVDDRLSLYKSRCVTVSMDGARVRGRVDMRSIECSGLLRMNGMRIDGAVFLKAARLAGAEFKRTWIGGHLESDDLRCTQILDMEDMRVASALFLRNATLDSLALSGTTIEGQLAPIRK